MNPYKARPWHDMLAVLLLVALCWLFFWRMLTAAPADRQSLVEGDFSGQFVAFAAYQAERLGAGEIPLWNPYNLGGHPFLADTQSAVFYPPRLISVALVNVAGGASPGSVYDALQKEMMAHTLLASLLMYAYVRRLTAGRAYSVAAGLVSGVIFAYGGYLTGYPQLQLAVMEAGIWLPLALLGMHEAMRRPRTEYRWFMLAGLALALSLLAGHPQTSLFFMYVTLAYLAWQVFTTRCRWTVFLLGAGVMLGIGGGLAAVQLWPGLEYLGLTSRGALTFDARGNGFPVYDFLQMVFPGVFSQWSPLYMSVIGLLLAVYGARRGGPAARFWMIVAGIAALLSLGQGTIVYDALYNLAPGFTLFRGQERAGYVFAAALAVLAGLGVIALLEDSAQRAVWRRFGWIVFALLTIVTAVVAQAFVLWLAANVDGELFRKVATALLMAGLAFIALGVVRRSVERRLAASAALIVGLAVFDLFSFARSSPNLEPVPAWERLPESSTVQAIRADMDGIFRVDGFRGVRENYGALYGVMDIRGISPLRLERVEALLNLPNRARVWEVFAVRYVPTEDRELPAPSRVVKRDGDVRLHRLTAPRPFARLVYTAWIEPDDAAARGILNEPAFASDTSVILNRAPDFTLPNEPQTGTARITAFAPESITVEVETPAPGILDLALVYYPGWRATLDGAPVEILRADTAFSAVGVPAGRHTLQFTFAPETYRAGALLSLITLVGCGVIFAILSIWVRSGRAVAG